MPTRLNRREFLSAAAAALAAVGCQHPGGVARGGVNKLEVKLLTGTADIAFLDLAAS